VLHLPSYGEGVHEVLHPPSYGEGVLEVFHPPSHGGGVSEESIPILVRIKCVGEITN